MMKMFALPFEWFEIIINDGSNEMVTEREGRPLI